MTAKNNKTFIIGLTGGILSGKSTIAQMLAEKGAAVIDADKLAHEAYKPKTKLNQELVDEFGPSIRQAEGSIDRKKLSKIVFGDSAALARLNGIVHPRMHEMARAKIASFRKKGTPVVVLEAALLIEAKWTDLVDEVWVALAPPEVAVNRLKERGGLTEDEARARIQAQLPAAERAKYTDVILNTDCDLSEVKSQVDKLWDTIANKEVSE
jgi:dephospho-CoA kinase